MGVAVRLHLRTRRLRCRNSLCSKRVFCERLPRVVAHYGRKTVRMNEALELIGFLFGGSDSLPMRFLAPLLKSALQLLSDVA